MAVDVGNIWHERGWIEHKRGWHQNATEMYTKGLDELQALGASDTGSELVLFQSFLFLIFLRMECPPHFPFAHFGVRLGYPNHQPGKHCRK